VEQLQTRSVRLCVADDEPLETSVFQYNRDGILIVSLERTVLTANQAFAVLSGYGIAELIGMNLDTLCSTAVSPKALIDICQELQANGRWAGETLGRKKNGEDQSINLTIVRVNRADKDFYIYTCIDVAGPSYAQARIEHMAFFDSLTGLPNRAYLVKHFASLTANVNSAPRTLAVVFLDLDGFKEINDTFGHTAGDTMLVQLAQRMSAGSASDTLICRFGGDEFILVLPDHDEERAARCMTELLMRISQPVSLEGQDISVTASVGISHYPKDGVDAETLVRHADTALYYAKANGKNTIVNFGLEMDVALSRRFGLLTALRCALERDEFVLRFQPIMDSATGTVVAAEALLYWNHPQFGTIGPSSFISLAEESGLIESIGEWVLDEALAHYSMWETRGFPRLGLAVNVSGFQVRRLENIEQKIRAAVAAGVIDPRKLTLEITERHFMHNLKTGLSVLQSLSATGVGLAIDDFGTGYSNLNYLKDLPITEIKIDISFIRNLVGDAGDRVIVKAIVDLSRSLSLRVVAEGVETAEQLAILKDYGCDDVQGFLFSRPIPSEEFVEFVLRNNQASTAAAENRHHNRRRGDLGRRPGLLSQAPG
jgi:diguanylate cyclase (GGDEF)-like protein/PAS domain S-box-containing protein